jgi:general secretion pathway protein C
VVARRLSKLNHKLLILCCSTIFICNYALILIGHESLPGLEPHPVSALEIPRLKTPTDSSLKKTAVDTYVESIRNNIKLVGTVTSDNRQFNLAIIEDRSKRCLAVYSEGSRLPDGSTITRIFSNHIILEKNGAENTLKITVGSGFDHEVASKGYKQVSATEWIVSPDKLYKSIGESAGICWQTRITSSETGLKIAKLPADSLLSKLGLLEGDIIKNIDGYAFDKIYAALNYLWNLKGDSAIKIAIVRSGHRLQLTYHPYANPAQKYVKTSTFTPHALSNMLSLRHNYTRNKIRFLE